MTLLLSETNSLRQWHYRPGTRKQPDGETNRLAERDLKRQRARDATRPQYIPTFRQAYGHPIETERDVVHPSFELWSPISRTPMFWKLAWTEPPTGWRTLNGLARSVAAA